MTDLQRLRAKRRAAGTCIDCQKPSMFFNRCQACRTLHATQQRARYQQRKAKAQEPQA